MKYWRVIRNTPRGPVVLGHYLADSLDLRALTLYAIRDGKVTGAIACGMDLHWTNIPFPGTSAKRARAGRKAAAKRRAKGKQNSGFGRNA